MCVRARARACVCVCVCVCVRACVRVLPRGAEAAERGTKVLSLPRRYSCVVLAGQRSNDERRTNLQHFKDGDVLPPARTPAALSLFAHAPPRPSPHAKPLTTTTTTTPM